MLTRMLNRSESSLGSCWPEQSLPFRPLVTPHKPQTSGLFAQLVKISCGVVPIVQPCRRVVLAVAVVRVCAVPLSVHGFHNGCICNLREHLLDCATSCVW
jgi:hypothetical protein